MDQCHAHFQGNAWVEFNAPEHRPLKLVFDLTAKVWTDPELTVDHLLCLELVLVHHPMTVAICTNPIGPFSLRLVFL